MMMSSSVYKSKSAYYDENLDSLAFLSIAKTKGLKE